MPARETNDPKLARMAYVILVSKIYQTLVIRIIFFINSTSLAQYNSNDDNQRIIGRILSRHENVDQSLKAFAILISVIEHPRIFKSCINLVQLAIENKEPLP